MNIFSGKYTKWDIADEISCIICIQTAHIIYCNTSSNIFVQIQSNENNSQQVS